ncbi:peptidyl-prolyl cis-trans isomerase D [bacterium A37T11]|nr:peptidyl-prolyl cis-trans isomerase D [bacterium A37T11]
MGVMNFLRNRAGIIIMVVIGLAIVAFLLGDVMHYANPFLASSRNEVGEIDGNAVDYPTFNEQVERLTNNFRQQMGGGEMSPQMRSYAIEQAWQQNVSSILLDKEVKRIGLEVGSNEMNDVVGGKNPSPTIVQYFGDPKTGELNREQLGNFIKTMNEQVNSPESQQWRELLKSLKNERLQQKYNNLVQNSVYVTSLEATEDFNQRNRLVNFDYVMLDYASVADKDVQLKDADYKKYYDENKGVYKNADETRSFDYVVFNAQPTSQDTLLAKETISKLAEELAKSSNDSLFAAVHAETKRPFIYQKKGQFGSLDSLIFSAPKGAIVGPVFSNGAFEIAKVVDARISPDSIKADHILINPVKEGGLAKAEAKADSIRKLVLGGASFAALAVEFGTDATKDNGGELGTFARGQMFSEFEDAVFNAKAGDVLVVNSRAGVHVVKIDKVVGLSPVVKAAIVDKRINSSSETLQSAYRKASAFFGTVNSANFSQQSKKDNYQILVADNISAMQGFIQNLENPRELVKWAFEAKVGDVTDKVIELDNKYVIAKLTGIRPKGQLPLELVKKDMEPQVRNQVKAVQLMAKLQNGIQGVKDINQLAQKIGKTATPVENVVFSNPIIPGVAQENRVVGTLFGLQPKKLSAPIAGNQGVYVAQVNNFVNPQAPENVQNLKLQMQQGIRQQISGATFRVLLEKADITDNRVKFF